MKAALLQGGIARSVDLLLEVRAWNVKEKILTSNCS